MTTATNSPTCVKNKKNWKGFTDQAGPGVTVGEFYFNDKNLKDLTDAQKGFVLKEILKDFADTGTLQFAPDTSIDDYEFISEMVHSDTNWQRHAEYYSKIHEACYHLDDCPAEEIEIIHVNNTLSNTIIAVEAAEYGFGPIGSTTLAQLKFDCLDLMERLFNQV